MVQTKCKLHNADIGGRAFFARGGGGAVDHLPQKILTSCPNFYETVERKRGSYDVPTMAYI